METDGVRYSKVQVLVPVSKEKSIERETIITEEQDISGHETTFQQVMAGILLSVTAKTILSKTSEHVR